MDDSLEPIYFADPAAFRAWLEEHHETEDEVWVGLYKKHTGRAGLVWADAVDQALCFGWIDGIAKRVDEDRHRQRFTPRRKGSSWSNVNLAKYAALEEQGLVAPRGRAAYEARVTERTGIYAYEAGNDTGLSEEYAARLAASPKATAFFEAQRPSYQRLARRWVMSAKQERTRDKRIAELVADCEAGLLIRSQRYGTGNNKPA